MNFSQVDPSKSSGSSGPCGDFDLHERSLIAFKPSPEESSVDNLKASTINVEEKSLEDLAHKEAERGINDMRTSILTWKDRGNFHLKRQELDLAIESYTKEARQNNISILEKI